MDLSKNYNSNTFEK